MSRRERDGRGFVVWLTGLSAAGKSTIAEALAPELSGEIMQLTGVSDPYEPPDAAEIAIDTSTLDLLTSVQRVKAVLAELGYLVDPRPALQSA